MPRQSHHGLCDVFKNLICLIRLRKGSIVQLFFCKLINTFIQSLGKGARNLTTLVKRKNTQNGEHNCARAEDARNDLGTQIEVWKFPGEKDCKNKKHDEGEYPPTLTQ